MATVAQFHKPRSRNGWYLQQLIKLYAGLVIPDILPKYLVIDSDTFFLKPTSFLSQDDKPLFGFGSENHAPYFAHMQRLHPEFAKQEPNLSGICHHMMFDTNYVKEMFAKVEQWHRGQPFYEVFLKMVTEVDLSGASEYELYFNYMLKYHKQAIMIRPLQWKNSNTLERNSGLHYVSCHWYERSGL
jgi:hypothetical protein